MPQIPLAIQLRTWSQTEPADLTSMKPAYSLGCTSEWHSEGQEFDPPWLHHPEPLEKTLDPLGGQEFSYYHLNSFNRSPRELSSVAS